MRAAYERIRQVDRPEVWITLRPEADALEDARRVDRDLAAGAELPLAGTAVAVKDNIDVAGLPTTAGCPDFAYIPEATAPAVARLVTAGAVVIGKTNLDQFATGLVGMRSPYGSVRHPSLADRIAGGSSSGSAVAVAVGICDIGVGTDTAGSGRIPAAFQGLVGFKPTLGVVPTGGIVPASRSYDCVSVFSTSVAAAEAAVAVMAGPPGRPWPAEAPLAAPPSPVIAIPEDGALGVLAPGWDEAFAAVVERLSSNGAQIVRVPVAAFLEGARLMYEGAIVAERYAAVGEFIDAHPESIDPSVRTIIGGARDIRAHELVRDRERVAAACADALEAMAAADVLLLPTAPEHPSPDAVAADPIGVNYRLGRLASFANLFDMAAVSVPAGDAGGGPFGVTVYSRAFGDRVAADVARRVAREPAAAGLTLGSGGHPLFVLGAHLSGQPLNGQLTARGARPLRKVRTASRYRMFALATEPIKPGLLEVGAGGASVDGELWELPPAALATVLAELPEPMLLGSVELDDGSFVTGFFCQASATSGADDISDFGGWRAYLSWRETESALAAPGPT